MSDLMYRVAGDPRCRVSKYLRTLPYDDSRTIIWHAIFGHPTLVTKPLADQLVFCRDLGLELEPEQLLGDLYSWQTAEELDRMDLMCHRVFHPDAHISEFTASHNDPDKSKVKALSLIMSEDCPFRCKYCIHFANAEHAYKGPRLMSHDIATTAINQYMTLMAKSDFDEAYINFGGGEPLLNWPLIATLLREIEDWRYVMPIKLGLNTNLALMTEEIAECLITHDVYVAASLDGLKRGNDAVRLTKNQTGTYDQIVKGFDIFANLGYPLDGFAMTVTEGNFADVGPELIDWAASRQMHEVRIDIDVVGAVNLEVAEIVERLVGVRSYAAKKGINVIGFWSRPAENMGLDLRRDDIAFCGAARGNSLCVAPSGDVYPCGYGNYCICDVDEIGLLPGLAPYKHILERHAKFYEEPGCADCEILGFCQGGCQITGEYDEPGKHDRMCELYRAMTREILKSQVAAALST